jgi:hypothetical protein
MSGCANAMKVDPLDVPGQDLSTLTVRVAKQQHSPRARASFKHRGFSYDEPRAQDPAHIP